MVLWVLFEKQFPESPSVMCTLNHGRESGHLIIQRPGSPIRLLFSCLKKIITIDKTGTRGKIKVTRSSFLK